MNKQEVVKKVSTLKVSKSLLEKLVGISKNNLSRWIKNPDQMPDKHAARIDAILCDIEMHKLDASNVAALITSLLVVANRQQIELRESLALYNNQTATIMRLEAKIAELEPLAASHQHRMQGVAEAVKNAPKQTLAVAPDNSIIYSQIEALQKAKIPKERDTILGRKSWELERQQQIDNLKKQLNG